MVHADWWDWRDAYEFLPNRWSMGPMACNVPLPASSEAAKEMEEHKWCDMSEMEDLRASIDTLSKELRKLRKVLEELSKGREQ